MTYQIIEVRGDRVIVLEDGEFMEKKIISLEEQEAFRKMTSTATYQ